MKCVKDLSINFKKIIKKSRSYKEKILWTFNELPKNKNSTHKMNSCPELMSNSHVLYTLYKSEFCKNFIF